MAENFILPDLGEGIHEAQIIQLLVQEGDVVEVDQPLMEVETDKAAVEIPSPSSGKIAKIHVQAGQTVNVGDVMVTFGENSQPAAAAAPPAEAPQKKPAKPEPPSPEPAGRAAPKAQPVVAESAPPATDTSPAKAGKPAKIAASPAVRRRAKELGIDLASIPATGPGGRVTKDDLERAAAGGAPPPAARRQAPTPAPAATAAVELPAAELPDFEKWGSVRREPIPQIRKTIANQMTRSEALNVHVTHHDLADVQMLEQLRKDHNARKRDQDPKLTMLPFVIKAVHAAMRRYPQFNTSFDHQAYEIIYKEYYNFGIAVDTPRGLVVPVLRDVDRKSIRELAAELIEIGAKAREAKFTIDELRGGTFTITNIGALGGIVATPIINYPEAAILGLGKAEMKPVVLDGAVVARYMLPLNLSFDHRIIDGADAARFVEDIKSYLEVPGRLLLEE